VTATDALFTELISYLEVLALYKCHIINSWTDDRVSKPISNISVYFTLIF